MIIGKCSLSNYNGREITVKTILRRNWQNQNKMADCSIIPTADTSRIIKRHIYTTSYLQILVYSFILVSLIGFNSSNSLECKSSQVCDQGKCVNDTCECFPGWGGESCNKCFGRISLNLSEGVIFDGADQYSQNQACSWLLDTGKDGNTSVRFVFQEFATECGWDHFYIHNGDSVFSPLIAAFSGLLVSKNMSIFEIIVHFSGRYGYFHFYSDALYTMDGFIIAYRVGGCYLNCSEFGECMNGVCHCDANRTGHGCEVDLNVCVNNCSGHGICNISRKCICDEGFRGDDCGFTEADILWEELSTQDPPEGRASHVALTEGNVMWVVGGFSLTANKALQLSKLDYNIRKWTHVQESTSNPWPLYTHSAVLFENKLYVYGGVRKSAAQDELWVFDIHTGNWSMNSTSGYPLSGHSAHVFMRTMLVFFGYSPIFGYFNRVLQYNFDSGDWQTLETKGALVQGVFGHASVYDEGTQKFFIYGGYQSEISSTSSLVNSLSDKLYAFDPFNKYWMLMQSSGYPRYLHSMVVLDGYLVIYGGNTHNDTSKSQGAKCYSSDFMLYDIKCNSWHSMTPPKLDNIARFGHSLTTFNGSIYLFGGFRGMVQNDLIHIELGHCNGYTNETECMEAVPGMTCFWNQSKCHASLLEDDCKTEDRYTSVCPGLNTCTSCLAAAKEKCTWCTNSVCGLNCSASDKTNNCSSTAEDTVCKIYYSCQACEEDHRCKWNVSKCTGAEPNKNDSKENLGTHCPKTPCAFFNSCTSCIGGSTGNRCMWCSNLEVCIDTIAYVAAFPYGQCMDWTTILAQCSAKRCSSIKSCKQCQSNPRCGWCNDAQNTGLGVCMDGGYLGSLSNASSGGSSMGDMPSSFSCSSDNWYFTVCPSCQCNGHATCIANTSICNSCAFPITGDHCETCRDFYFGNPVNGGNCTECQCNGQAETCNQETGDCYCQTRGVTGASCDRCDDAHKYYGDPRNGGTCYYRLSTDYQYTFNLSKKEDTNFTQINFVCTPSSSDRDVDFMLNCSGSAVLNITYKSKNFDEERIVTSLQACGYYRAKFEHKDYPFGGEMNTTFFIYVYNFKTPFGLQISFSQFPKIDLVHFFVTFFSCFLSLLLIAALLWKIKHKYDSYRRRQQLMVEMLQMASRPFSAVSMEVDRKGDPAISGGPPERKDLKDHVDLRRRKKLANKPSAIAIEPLFGNKAAVLTLLIQLPFGEGDFSPSGQSGLAVGSALVSIGTNRKQSLEHIKGDRSRVRKYLYHTHPDNIA